MKKVDVCIVMREPSVLIMYKIVKSFGESKYLLIGLLVLIIESKWLGFFLVRFYTLMTSFSMSETCRITLSDKEPDVPWGAIII